MQVNNNGSAPEDGIQAPAQPEGDLRAELDRVRNKNKTLKILAWIFLAVFLIAAAGAFYVYRKVSATKDAFEQAFRAFPPPPAGYQPENRTLPMNQGVPGSTSMPASTLGLFSGGLPGNSGPGGIDPEQGRKILSAMNKYADRPIVKEFIADLKKNPGMASAFAESKGGNPLAVLANIRNAKGMDKLVMKYAMRPEFMSLMMEFMNDPEMKPLMQNMPPGMGMPAGFGIPSGQPQGGAVPVPAGQSSRNARRQDYEEEDEDGDGDITFDPSAISGPVKQAPANAKKVPLPVDRD